MRGTPHARRPAAGFLLVAWLACGGTASGSVLTGPVVNPANGHRYYLTSQNGWTASESEAVGLGGHLATVNDAAEDAWIYSTFSHFGGVNRNLWIGLHDLDPAVNSTARATRRSEFGWVSGEPVTYTSWSAVEPNNPTSGEPANPEFYVHIWNPTDPNPARWNNYYDLNAEFGIGLFGVAEVVPEPSALAAACAASPLLLWGRRRRRRGAGSLVSET